MAGRDRPLGLRLTDIEFTKVQKLAGSLGVTPSELVRKLLVAAFDTRYRAPAGAQADASIRFDEEPPA